MVKYEDCSESIQPRAMEHRDIYWRRYKKHCAQDSDTSVPCKVGTLGPHTVLPIAIGYSVIFYWISSTVWNLFHFKGDFSFGRSQKGTRFSGYQIWAVRGLSHLGDLMFHQKTVQDMMHEWACGHDAAATHQLPIAVAFWVTQIISVEKCSSLTRNWICRFIALLAQWFWMWQPHSAHSHSMASTTPPD